MDTPVAYGCTVNRELSWLAFNQRVLEEAALPSRPPLDRLTFLGIFLSNLDEFFRVRVGSLIDQCAVEPPPIDDKTGWTPAQQLAAAVREAAAHAKEPDDAPRKKAKIKKSGPSSTM